MNIEQAYNYCMQITRNHYENFPVASLFIPAEKRPHIAAVYAFARTADDFSDEHADRGKLLEWRQHLHSCIGGTADHPVFIALSDTINKFNLPVEWLDNLITAFIMDLDKNRFANFEELYDYCRYSANPVGRIILWLFNIQSENTMKDADKITTALQLTNFWQDLSIDLKKDRLYIPQDSLQRFEIDESQIIKQKYSKNFSLLLNSLIEETRSLFYQGINLFPQLKGRLRWELKLTTLGGLTILEKVYRFHKKILYSRPVLSRWDWLKIMMKSSVKFN